MFEIVPIADTSETALHESMCVAFSDYLVPMCPTLDQFRFMLRQRGFNKELSWLAKSDDRIIGFWLLGSHAKASPKSAYVIATGTRPQYRGQGIATKIFEELSRSLAGRGLENLELEVIDQNTAARKAYEKLGFRTEREVVCFKLPLPAPNPSPSIQPGIGTIPFETVQSSGPGLWDWRPTWQNSLESLNRIRRDLEMIGVCDGDDLLGYAAVIRPTSTLAQLAVRADCRRQVIGSKILAALSARLETNSLQIINAAASDSAFADFIRSKQGTAGTKQTVLSLKL